MDLYRVPLETLSGMSYLCMTTNPSYRGKQLPRKVRTAQSNPPVNSRRFKQLRQRKCHRK